MQPAEAPAHPSVYLLADHLDAVLASGEDLLRLRLTLGTPPAGASPEDVLRHAAGRRAFIESVRRLEMALVARALQARERALELAAVDFRFKPLLGLFLGGTAPLVDAVAELGDATGADFETADDALETLRHRGLLAADAAGLTTLAELPMTEDFLVIGRIPLGPLLDLVATFLDKLEDHHELFAEAPATGAAEPGTSEAAA